MERSRPLVEALEELSAEYGATPAQVALSWLVNAHGETVVAIPGASKAHHAEQSAGAMKLGLSDLDSAKLDVLSRAFR